MATNVFQELKRRKVVRVAVVYALVGFGVIEVAANTFPNLGVPDWGVTLVIALVILGFPLALVLSWMFDVTPQGIERTGAEVDGGTTVESEPRMDAASAVAESDMATAAAEPHTAAPVPELDQAPDLRIPDVSAETSQAESVPAAGEPAAAAAAATPSAPLTSIAVLPFGNMSDSAENEYFSDGMTEDILAQISLIGALDVVSHTSVKRYKGTEKPIAEIATELGVGCVLEGSVRRAGDRVRIVAQLIDAGTDRHLWAETYDRQLTDVFAVQSDVARKIASALEAELTEDEHTRLEETPTESIEAYELVLKGRFALATVTETGFKQAIDFYQAALDIQPDYLEALVGLATVQVALPYWSTFPPDEQSERSANLARHLTRIDPTSPEAHFVAGALQMVGGWNWEKARSELDEAIRLDSANYFSRYTRALLELYMGDLENATEMVLEACELNPGDALIEGWTGQFLGVAGRFRESIEILEPWITREPLHLFPPLFTGVAYAALGDVEKGLGLIERARELSEGAPWAELTRCIALQLAGREDEAAGVAADLVGRSADEHISPYMISAALLQTGDAERALDYLERALEDRDPVLPAIGGVLRWRRLHGNPRFDAVFQEVFPGREPPQRLARSGLRGTGTEGG